MSRKSALATQAGTNTRMEYLYRDGSNWKSWGEVTFRGAPSPESLARLRKAFNSGDYFIAEQVRVRELFFDSGPYAEDHCWHEFSQVESTTNPGDDPYDRTFDEFVAECETAAEVGWKQFDWFDREIFQPR